MVFSFCKLFLEKFVDCFVFKCVVRVGRNFFIYREDSSFVKCFDGVFGDIVNLVKVWNGNKNY